MLFLPSLHPLWETNSADSKSGGSIHTCKFYELLSTALLGDRIIRVERELIAKFDSARKAGSGLKFVSLARKMPYYGMSLNAWTNSSPKETSRGWKKQNWEEHIHLRHVSLVPAPTGVRGLFIKAVRKWICYGSMVLQVRMPPSNYQIRCLQGKGFNHRWDSASHYTGRRISYN